MRTVGDRRIDPRCSGREGSDDRLRVSKHLLRTQAAGQQAAEDEESDPYSAFGSIHDSINSTRIAYPPKTHF
jgi:hypothetical protein